VHIHQYDYRLVRSNETGQNEPILIFSIYCERAKKNGTQYTKRILPSFVIPECNITLENVLEAYTRNPSEKIDYDAASVTMGTMCEATIRTHFTRVSQMIDTACLFLIHFFTTIPQIIKLEKPQIGIERYTQLLQYIQLFEKAIIKAGIPHTGKVLLLKVLHTTYMKERTRSPVKIPMNLISLYLFFHDTS
jgi:hypothetical protein